MGLRRRLLWQVCWERISGGVGEWYYDIHPQYWLGSKASRQYFRRWRCEKISGGGGIWRYPSPSTDWGVRSPAGIFGYVRCAFQYRRYWGEVQWPFGYGPEEAFTMACLLWENIWLGAGVRDMTSKVSRQYFRRVRCEKISGGTGIWRYPSFSTDWGVRPPAGIFGNVRYAFQYRRYWGGVQWPVGEVDNYIETYRRSPLPSEGPRSDDQSTDAVPQTASLGPVCHPEVSSSGLRVI